MTLDENGRVSASDALNVFNDANKKWLDERAVVSMSAGFDSRVILSSVLSAGYKPRLLSMGYDNSTDVVVSRSISSDLDLPLDVVSLEADDYIKYGKRISPFCSLVQMASLRGLFIMIMGFWLSGKICGHRSRFMICGGGVFISHLG
jgi:hypothetical protein